MRRKFILLFWLCLLAVKVYYQNQMDLMNTLYGEFNGDEYGAEMVSMDYNGDGYDDLIVIAPFWNDSGVLGVYYPGKIYFYWGGPNGLANTPDCVIEGQRHRDFAPYMCNAGDMNGDGIDDLAITYSTDVPWGTYKSILIPVIRLKRASVSSSKGMHIHPKVSMLTVSSISAGNASEKG